jgi:hypothetical protein
MIFGWSENRRRPQRRRMTYPNLIEIRRHHGNTPCECCKLRADYAVQYEASESSNGLSEIFVCEGHHRMILRKQWAKVFGDQNRKIRETEDAP